MRKPNPGKKAARASWLAPILIFVIDRLLIDDQTEKSVVLTTSAIQVFLILIGTGAAIYALVSIRTHGRRGILIPASIGLLLNAGYLALLGYLIYMLVRPGN